MTLRIYSHPDCLQHDTGPGHPECSARLQGILDKLAALQAFASHFDAPLGSNAQTLLAHTPEYLQALEAAVPASGRTALDADTLMSPLSLQAARYGVGAACQGVDDLLSDRCRTVFCATRPPGHHATMASAMGFCLLNHVAIAALHARNSHGLERVAIVDFDVHHGNGSQDILAGKPGVLYISTHQSPLYPGSGSEAENIADNILNIPLAAGTDGEHYRAVFKTEVLPALAHFAPQLLLISAGFDAHRQDPLAGLALEESDYQWLGQQLQSVADKHCRGRLLAALEGGYNLEVLGDSVLAFLNGLQR